MKSTKKKKQARGLKPTCKDVTEEEKKRQMTMQEASPAPAPSAQFVGNAFVQQYYHILNQSPNLAHKFYKESSFLGRPDSQGDMITVTSLQAINDKILSVNYECYTSEIKTVDAQESFEQGLMVLVTGCLTGKDDSRRKFTQTFFLAPQDKGYYVLNDVFRFIEEKDTLQMHSTSINAISEDAAVDAATELDQCGNNVEKALDALDKSASSSNKSRNDKHIDVPVENVDAMRFLVELK
ncbi:ras GTPase-activating protein-binding protein 2 [Quillaja saponaria]|uniref:Ras GTPase-activating protein-binding protein 2 n=1 Tax=Quillaja saponaria TaxID=32244 RepID=A0AAD7LKF9_QUISA|nr:ras GTPase-activating protein-binding protein 2 [Quillaja saponaria]